MAGIQLLLEDASLSLRCLWTFDSKRTKEVYDDPVLVQADVELRLTSTLERAVEVPWKAWHLYLRQCSWRRKG